MVTWYRMWGNLVALNAGIAGNVGTGGMVSVVVLGAAFGCTVVGIGDGVLVGVSLCVILRSNEVINSNACNVLLSRCNLLFNL